MKFYIASFLSFCFSLQLVLHGQDLPLNATLVAHVPFSENSSGMWGYTDAKGIKYAVIGTLSAARVFSLEDPKNPTLRLVAPGAVGNWREVRYYKNFIYVSTDQGADGLLVIDMTNAPDSITYSFYKPEIAIGTTTRNLGRCHNIFIDEKGYCYLSGCSISNRGVLVFDLNLNPTEPPFVGYTDLRYSHDVYVKNDTMYNSEISDGLLSIYDVKDKAEIKLLTSFSTGRTFTHNAWTSDDSKYVFTTDERANAYVESYDISDFSNVKLLDRFRPLRSENTGVIPHNTYYKNGYLITSYYTDGIIIIDAHKPDNLIEVAYYDTWNDPSICHSGFHGVWGVYPLDDEDYVYGSDIENGLFILKFDYKRACYLEGKITDSNGTPLSNVMVEIISDQKNRKLSGPSGEYKTGQVLSGEFKVRISHPDYYSKEEIVLLDHGLVTKLDVNLEKRPTSQVTFVIKNTDNETVVPSIKLLGDGYQYNLLSNGDSEFKALVRDGKYSVFITQWGYDFKYLQDVFIKNGDTNTFEATLEKRYSDNFESDLKWQITATPNMQGIWVRGIPKQTLYLNGVIANPGVDSDDVGDEAFVTTNGIQGAGCADVDNGVTKLTSPMMDLSVYHKPALNYDVWFFNAGGAVQINDTLVIKVNNGNQEVIVDKIYGTTEGWLKVRKLDISSFIHVTDQMRLIVEASDQQGNLGHIVEAGFDHFFISDLTSSVNDKNENADIVTVYPNPASDFLFVRLDGNRSSQNVPYYITNTLGEKVKSGVFDFHSSSIDIANFSTGLYILQIEGKHAVKFFKN